MGNKELFTGLMNLHFRLEVAGKKQEAELVRQAAAVVLAQSKYEACKTETSNGDPVATFFTNVVKVQKGA